MPKNCEHFDPAHIKIAKAQECAECVKTGATWVHLRTCQTCGETFCCNDSKNQHANRHFRTTKHPVIISAEPGEKWAWCYADGKYMKY